MYFLLSVLAVVLFVWGVVSLVRGAILVGVLLIVAVCLVGPGGISVFH